VTWLTRSDYRDAAKTVYADAERLQYQIGEEALFRAHVSTVEKLKEQLKSAKIVLSLTRLQSVSEVPVFRRRSAMGRAITASASRWARPAATASKPPRSPPMGRRSIATRSTCKSLRRTWRPTNPRANLRLMRRIAELSGGKYFDFAQAGQAFDALLSRPVGFSKPAWKSWSYEQRLDDGDLMGLLIVEWFMRKKMGLI